MCLFKFIHGLLCLPFLFLLIIFLLLSSFIIIIVVIIFFLLLNELVKIILMFFCNSSYFIFSWFQLNSLHQFYIRWCSFIHYAELFYSFICLLFSSSSFPFFTLLWITLKVKCNNWKVSTHQATDCFFCIFSLSIDAQFSNKWEKYST